MNYELLGAIIAVIGLMITMYKIQRTNVKEFTKLQDLSENNAKEIAVIKHDIQIIVTERTTIVKEIYGKMTELEKMHITDMKETAKIIELSVKEVNCAIANQYKEILSKLDSVTKELNDLSGQWKEYRRSHNGGITRKKDI